MSSDELNFRYRIDFYQVELRRIHAGESSVLVLKRSARKIMKRYRILVPSVVYLVEEGRISRSLVLTEEALRVLEEVERESL